MSTSIERPILFSGAMVRAILAGTKTQTRRPVRPEPMMVLDHKTAPWSGDAAALQVLLRGAGRKQPAEVDDVLWVRETFATLEAGSYAEARPCSSFVGEVRYRADDRLADCAADVRGYRWRPSIHMPRLAARLFLRVTDVRVERVQDITEEDALAEGVTPRHVPPSGWIHRGESHVEAFSSAWAAIYGADSWNANPWIWRIAFERCEQPGGAR